MEFATVCRLCGEHSNTRTYSIFSKNDSGQQLIQLIKQCVPIVVYRTDPLSKEICETCYTKLNDYSLFITTSVKTNASFNSKLVDRINESPVRLYFNCLKNVHELDTEDANYRNLRSVKNFASQITVETRTQYTNTVEQKPSMSEQNIPPKNIMILTPSKINELNEKATSYNSHSLEKVENPRKRRRIIGPKSKLKFISTNDNKSPLSLLQYALTQVNRNLKLHIESYSDRFVSESSEISENSQSPLHTTTENNDFYPQMSLLEPNIDIMEQNVAIDNTYSSIDLNEPAICNYCLKQFKNIVDLAHHEIQHIKVDMGPKVDSGEFSVKQRKLARYYQNWLHRQWMYNLESEGSQSTSNEGSQNEEENVTQEDKPQDEENSLLVPTFASSSHVFSIKDNEIYVNGILLKSMDKVNRRTLYKNVMINGVKRKFCSLCRHTFKDNWAIEGHYFNNVCQYTCKYCGRKFKYHKELFYEHLQMHKGEPNNKIFGPQDRGYHFKKKKFMNHTQHNRSVLTSQMIPVPPKVKPIKMKHLLQNKINKPPVAIKTEPDLPPMNEAVTLEASGSSNQKPHQAYFCRKCFKVFFKVEQYNNHIRICTGEETNAKNSVKSPETSITLSKRPVRSCVKDISSITDVDDDSQEEFTIKKSSKKIEKSTESGFECGVCCSSFPTLHSRNSHMRIHKGQSPKTVLNKVAAKSHAITKPEPQHSIPPAAVAQVQSPDLRLAHLNPTVARLVQNNPHLTIRSYSKSDVERQAERQMQAASGDSSSSDVVPDHLIKRVYRCSDCNEKFENKSVLYYHKMNNCVIKKHYECAFCRKRFGTYDQYNTHMFYVHPE